MFAGETYKDRQRWDLAFETSLKLHQVFDVRLQATDKNGGEQLARSGRSNQRRKTATVSLSLPFSHYYVKWWRQFRLILLKWRVNLGVGYISRHCLGFAGLSFIWTLFSVLCIPAVLCCVVLCCYLLYYLKLISFFFIQTWAWVESWRPAVPGQQIRGPATLLMGEYDTPPHTHTQTDTLPPPHSEIIMHSIIFCSPLSVTQWLHLSAINAALFVISFIPAVYVSCYWFWPEVLSPSVNVLIYLLM